MVKIEEFNEVEEGTFEQVINGFKYALEIADGKESAECVIACNL